MTLNRRIIRSTNIPSHINTRMVHFIGLLHVRVVFKCDFHVILLGLHESKA